MLISVIIPCFNQGVFIEEAIKSVEICHINDYEIIIINDGSTDNETIQILMRLKEKGYYVIFQDNQGLGKARNNGIKLAKGKYILPLDADNKIYPTYISKALEIMENDSDISIVYADRRLFGASEIDIKVGSFSLEKILAGNYIDACAIYRKNVWTEVGGYDENMPMQGLEDWDFWLGAAEKGFKFRYIPEVLFEYRVSKDSMINKLKKNPKKNNLELYIYKKRLEFLINVYRENIYNTIYLDNYNNENPLKVSIHYLKKWAKSLTN